LFCVCWAVQGANITNTDWTDVVLRKDQQVRGRECYDQGRS
jgi:hypothetical protein